VNAKEKHLRRHLRFPHDRLSFPEFPGATLHAGHDVPRVHNAVRSIATLVLVEGGCLGCGSDGRIHIGLNFRLVQCPIINTHIINDPVKTITTTVKAGPLSNICVHRSIDL
jgi:hypothetical protein